MDGDRDGKQRAKDLKCHQCGATMGVISSSGILELATSTRLACNACRPFEELYDNIQKTDEEYKKLQLRRSKLGARRDAFENQRNAHMALGNFVQQLDQVDSAAAPTETASPDDADMNADSDIADLSEDQDNTASNGDLAQLNPDTASTNKRPRSLSAPTDLPAQSPEKRFRMQKKVNFDATAVLRDEYRSSGAYQRGTISYVRGRNAAPEGTEFLDTSGHNQMFRDFHQMVWDRRQRMWVNSPGQDGNEEGVVQDSENIEEEVVAAEAIRVPTEEAGGEIVKEKPEERYGRGMRNRRPRDGR